MHRELEPLGGFAYSIPTTMWEWVTSLFEDTKRKDIDDYLAQSTNHYELEQRIKTLTRKGLM